MTRKESAIAVVILAMVAVSLGLLFWGMRLDDGAERIGPIRSLSVGGQEGLAVFHANHLHLLDASGRRLGRQALLDLAMTEEPNDMDWTVDADGKVQAWFFEDTTPRLVRCDVAPAGMRLERCAQVAAGAQLKVNARSQAVHIAVDVRRNRIFIADAKGHAVRALSLDGKVLGESVQGDLFFPNRLRLAGDLLMVADNDHRRLAWLDVGADKPGFAVRRTLQASSHPQANSAHTKVTDFAFIPDADGQAAVLWMLAVAQGQKNGDVLTWGPAMKPAPRADLGGSSDPLAIDRLGNAAVVADFNGVALYRVDADGKNLGPFGEGAFQQELRSSRDRIAAAALWVKAGWAAFAATLVIGFLLAWRYGEKPGQQAARAAFAGLAQVTAAVPDRPVELKPQDWYGRQIVLLGIAGAAMVLSLPAVAWFVFPHEFPPGLFEGPKAWRMVGMVAVLWAAVPLMLRQAWRLSQRRLVLDRAMAQVHAGPRIAASAPMHEVFASPHALLIGGVMLPYRGRTAMGKPGRWIYDEDKLTRYLLVHLPVNQRVAQPELARALMKRMPKWQMLAMWGLCVAYVLFEAWRLWGRA
jgi:hypothetical protein